MGLYNPEVHLWTITSWSARASARGYGFTLWASPKFLAAAQEVFFNYDELQQPARKLVRDAGFEVSDQTDLLSFVGLGLDSFQVPGDGCCVSRTGLSDGSAVYRSHNVDTAEQQTALLALWFLWVQFVEEDLWKRIGGAPIASAMQK